MKLKTPSKNTQSRRQFLQRTALTTAGLSLAMPHLRSAEAVIGEGERAGIRVGCIGVGNQGKMHLLRNHKNVVAVSEVDSDRLAVARKEIEDRTGRKCAAFTDYRDLLESKEVDAVIIATPDHWHALQCIHACQAGKDVYVEKPLDLVIEEGRVMTRIARDYDRVVQCGSQQRSDDRFRLACELVRSGRIGRLQTIKVGLPAVNYSATPVPDSLPPETLNYDLWLGPAPWRPYNKNRVHYNFRFFWNYSGGQMTNWGAHHLDIAQWGLGMDESGPVLVEGEAKFDPEEQVEVPLESELRYRYANGVTLYCSQGPNRTTGTTFIGDQGSIYVNRGKLTSDPAGIVEEPLKDSDVHLYVSKDHHANWYQCIKSRKRPICDVEIAHRSATVCHLGSIALRTGQALRWDPVAEMIIGDPEASALQSYVYRKPWSLPLL